MSGKLKAGTVGVPQLRYFGFAQYESAQVASAQADASAKAEAVPTRWHSLSFALTPLAIRSLSVN